MTAIVVKLASNVHFLDTPIDRSAHTIPTPTGGGIAFVLPYAVVLQNKATLPQLSISASPSNRRRRGHVVKRVTPLPTDRQHGSQKVEPSDGPDEVA